MSYRVTQLSMSRTTMVGLQDNLNRLQRSQEQLSSGRRLNRPSDSPVDTVSAMQLRADKQRSEQYDRNIDDGLAWLGTADKALTVANERVTRVRQLVVSGLNATNGATERQALAAEVDQVRSGLISTANTQYLGKPVFAGTQSTSYAFDPVTGAYAGNGGAVKRAVSSDPGSGTVAVNVPGTDAFGSLLSDEASGGILAGVSAALRSGNTAALSAALTALDASATTMSGAHSLVGARYNRLETVQAQATAHMDAVTTSLSDAENVDLAKAILDVQLQQTAYQASLGVAAKIIQPSLMDFLR